MKLLFFLAAVVFLCPWLSSIAGDDPLFPIKEKGKWGYMNGEGEVVIEPQYTGCWKWQDGDLLAVEIDRKWGFVDRSNEIVIPAIYDSVRSFGNGVALVSTGRHGEGPIKWEAIGTDGEVLFDLNGESFPLDLCNGLIEARKGKKWGYINRKGEWVIAPIYKRTTDFSEGLAGVEKPDGTAGFIDTKGNWVVQLEGSVPCYYGFSGGLAPVMDRTTGKYGYINRSGELVIAAVYESARSFSEGLAVVQVATPDATGWPVRKFGVIDRNGTLVIPARYSSIGTFSHGLARVRLDGGKFGYIDKEGGLLIPFQFDGADSFAHGLARVQMGDWPESTRWDGYIDRTGAFVWRPSDYAATDQARLDEELKEREKVPSVRLLTDVNSKEDGIFVGCPKQIPFQGEGAGEVPLYIWNYLEQEVFLITSDFDEFGYIFEHYDGGRSGDSGAGGSRTEDPTIRILHASSYRKGRRMACGCASMRAKLQLPPSLLEAGWSRGTINVKIEGYYRNTGEHFYDTIDLPVDLVESVDDQVQWIAPTVDSDVDGDDDDGFDF